MAKLIKISNSRFINIDNITTIEPIFFKDVDIEDQLNRLNVPKWNKLEFVATNGSWIDAKHGVEVDPQVRALSQGSRAGYWKLTDEVGYYGPTIVDGVLITKDELLNVLKGHEEDVYAYRLHFNSPAYGINGGSYTITISCSDLETIWKFAEPKIAA